MLPMSLAPKKSVFLSHPDGGLEDTMLFRGQLVREIRRHKPEAVLCIDPHRINSHSHRDHRVSGQVTLDAAFTYAWSYLHFPEQITQEGLEPHQVLDAYLWSSDSPDTYVDITEYTELKAESLSAHMSQMGSWDPAERIREWSARQGEAAGLAAAEGFRRIRFDLGSLACQLMNF